VEWDAQSHAIVSGQLIDDDEVEHSAPVVMLHVTHPAIAYSDMMACIDITRFVLPGCTQR
jgi:hypothetical protein